MIIDEGQVIENPESSTAIAARHIKSDMKFILTGTPIENEYLDLWSLVEFVSPGLLGTLKNFRKSFGKKSRHRGQSDSVDLTHEEQ